MPIQANNCDANQRLGVHSAQFRLFAGGALDGEFLFPLAGPKSIRRIVVTTGANDDVANVALTLNVNQSVGGDVIAAAKAGNGAVNTSFTWEENELDNAAMGSGFVGIVLEVAGSGAAYDFRVEVLYSSELLAGLPVAQNQDVEGL